MNKPKILIEVKGGMVGTVLSTSPDVEITVINYDVLLEDDHDCQVTYNQTKPDRIITDKEYFQLIIYNEMIEYAERHHL